MGQSLAQVYIHLTFGTKHRIPMISESIESQLHAYIAGILKSYQCPALEINSVPDHIHILFRLSRTVTLADIVEQVKKESSKWIKRQKGGHNNFRWQSGYGAFSVSSSKVEVVRRYIHNQKKHHKVHSYREELETFFKKCDLGGYEEQYFWR